MTFVARLLDADAPFAFLVGVLLILMVILVVGVLRQLRRHRYRAIATIGGHAQEHVRDLLLTFVEERSVDGRSAVELRPFWSDKDLSTADRHVVIVPLLQRGLLLPARPGARGVRLLRELLPRTFAGPPAYVRPGAVQERSRSEAGHHVFRDGEPSVSRHPRTPSTSTRRMDR
ncbi:hypothetical protein [Microbacterium sp.]|uniref:hypothetical protein n=1 Tax=Microbacterium sp. TaxID=51671 RepID=UPI0033406699